MAWALVRDVLSGVLVTCPAGGRQELQGALGQVSSKVPLQVASLPGLLLTQ